MTENEFLKGIPPLTSRINIREELKRLAPDPLTPLITKLKVDKDIQIYSDEISRYLDAYWFFYLSLERFLPELGYTTRWEKSLRYVRGRGQKYSPSQKKLSSNYHASRKYLLYDLFNCLLHSRILMDRVAGVSRSFIKNGQAPSFTSFADHKKFFQKVQRPYDNHEEYARYICDETDWFDHLKEIRDHFLVHQSPTHFRALGLDAVGWDIHLFIMVPNKPYDGTMQDTLQISIPSLAREIEKFLYWFNQYALTVLDSENLT